MRSLCESSYDVFNVNGLSTKNNSTVPQSSVTVNEPNFPSAQKPTELKVETSKNLQLETILEQSNVNLEHSPTYNNGTNLVDSFLINEEMSKVDEEESSIQPYIESEPH